MTTDLLEVQPQELKFTFELKKQSLCSLKLVNKSNNHVAFKVKTTSPTKYCVRPNAGVIEPNSTCDVTVTLQAQSVTPPDMICKDKFLLQSTVVPLREAYKDITSRTFAKDDGKYVEEMKLQVIFVSPPHSPILSPINGTMKQVPVYEDSTLTDRLSNEVENHSLRHYYSLPHTVIEDVKESEVENDESELTKNVKVKSDEFKMMKNVEELKLVKDIEEIKSKLNGLESKLRETEVTISKLTEERSLTTKEGETLLQELALVRSQRSIRRVQEGLPLLFVCIGALLGVVLGYLSYRC